ncbi:MAG: TonB-dependent receptor [Caulobacter sp.]|nr:TonB-dependent receptor [Caulobacter sp.]
MPAIRKLSRAALLASISLAPIALASPALAEETTVVEEIIITATRRDTTVQDAPINIAAVGAQAIEKQGFTDLSDIAAYVPGIHLVDQGGRDGSRIVVRGLNADPLGASEGVGNTTGGMVATYLGEIPIVVDLKLNDLERVEFLLGPQGTLYGAGTMAGAIRYIPKRPSFAGPELELRAEGYQYSEAEDISSDVGLTFNYPFSDSFAVRGSIDYLNDSGFIDYTSVVNEIGVSSPNTFLPADVHEVPDANTEETLSGRLGFRFAPTDRFDANLTYYFQRQDIGARQVSQRRVDTLPIDVGKYENALRVLEPNKRDNDLISLEATMDLGFATLTSATGFSRYEEHGQRDQTDLLIGLDYGYEGFPSFTSFTAEDAEEESAVQELRLVSQTEGPLSWIVGGFYSKFTSDSTSKEFTPGLPAYWGINRPDALEYLQVNRTELKEFALFGEVTYKVTDAWQVTVGARRYSYELQTRDAVALPMYESSLGAGPDEINLNFEVGGQKDDGWLFKINTSYEFTPDLMAYATISEGYRTGNSNGVGPCTTPPGGPCGLPNEMAYFPDKTINYELGVKSQWLDRRLTLNGALFYVDWKDPQVAAATENGQLPITKNGEAARSYGAEFDFAWNVTSSFSVRGNYSYAKAELTETTDFLIPYITPQPGGPYFNGTIAYLPGEDGDRLPGSPEHEFSLFLDYSTELSNGWRIDLSYGLSAISDVLTRVGGKADSISVGDFTISDASIKLTAADDFEVTLFARNLFDEFGETAARATPVWNQVLEDDNGDPVYARSFFTSVIPPRAIGVRVVKRFGW